MSGKRLEEPLTEAELAKYEQAMVEMRAVLDASQTMLSTSLDPPVADSLMGRAYAARLRDPYEISRVINFTAEDHLYTVLQVMETTLLPTFALYTLLRTAGEAAATVAYLLDRSIDERVRLARALNVRLRELQAQEQADANAEFFSRAVAHVEQRALSNGINVLRRRARSGVGEVVAGFDQVMPGRTALFRQYIPVGGVMYSWLSGHAHAMNWVRMDKDKARPTEDPYVKEMPLTLNVELLANAVLLIVRLHEQNVIRLLQCAGYPVDLWHEAKTSSLQRARDMLAKLKTGGRPNRPLPPGAVLGIVVVLVGFGYWLRAACVVSC